MWWLWKSKPGAHPPRPSSPLVSATHPPPCGYPPGHSGKKTADHPRSRHGGGKMSHWAENDWGTWRWSYTTRCVPEQLSYCSFLQAETSERIFYEENFLLRFLVYFFWSYSLGGLICQSLVSWALEPARVNSLLPVVRFGECCLTLFKSQLILQWWMVIPPLLSWREGQIRFISTVLTRVLNTWFTHIYSEITPLEERAEKQIIQNP